VLAARSSTDARKTLKDAIKAGVANAQVDYGQAATELADALRFTIVAPTDEAYASMVTQALAGFNEQGFEVNVARNFLGQRVLQRGQRPDSSIPPATCSRVQLPRRRATTRRSPRASALEQRRVSRRSPTPSSGRTSRPAPRDRECCPTAAGDGDVPGLTVWGHGG